MADKSEALIAAQLDEMALKIMMVEPGDLSVVGELVILVENLQRMTGIDAFPSLKNMGQALRAVIGQIVMTELPDSAENYERLGQCIGQMQEIFRKHGKDEAAEKAFALILNQIGYVPAADDEGEEKEDVTAEVQSPSLAPQATTSASQSAKAAVTTGAPQGLRILNSPPVEAMEFLQDPELLTGFVSETLEHLESIEVNVLELEDNPGDLDIFFFKQKTAYEMIW